MKYIRAGGRHIWAFERHEEGFPPSLKDPPETCPNSVYLTGDRSTLSNPLVAVVGSRAASAEALSRAEEVGRLVAGVGHLVTGLAPGVDASAAEGALRAGGRVVGVRPWLLPPGGELFTEVASRGCVLSHNLYKLRGDPSWVNSQFYLRNIVIALLSEAVIVVEAHPGGGTMHMLEVVRNRLRPVYILKPSSGGEALQAYEEFLRSGAKPLNTLKPTFDRCGRNL